MRHAPYSVQLLGRAAILLVAIVAVALALHPLQRDERSLAVPTNSTVPCEVSGSPHTLPYTRERVLRGNLEERGEFSASLAFVEEEPVVVAQVPEAEWGWFEKGLRVTVRLPNGTAIPAHVGQLPETTVTSKGESAFRVSIDLDDPSPARDPLIALEGGRIYYPSREAVPVRVETVTVLAEDVLIVPANAIQTTEEGDTYVTTSTAYPRHCCETQNCGIQVWFEPEEVVPVETGVVSEGLVEIVEVGSEMLAPGVMLYIPG